MKRPAFVALLLIALGAIMQFRPWHQSSLHSEAESARSRDSSAAMGSPTPAQRATPSGALPERTAQGAVERSAAEPLRIAVHAPATAQSGVTFPVTVEVQAAQGIRQLVFSVVYKKSILQLVVSSPGAFARQGGPSVEFEEVSDGSVLVRIGPEGGVLTGAGSVAVIEFQALRRGVSPLAIHGVTYVAEGRQDASNIPTAYEGSITVE